MAYVIDKSKCTACGSCAEGCPEEAITFAPIKGVYQIEAEKCIDCGACETTCASDAAKSSL